MFNAKAKRALAMMLGTTMVLTGIASGNVEAAKKAKLAKKAYNVTIGEKVTIKLSKKNKKATYKFKATKKGIVSVSKRGVVKGIKVGKATIKVTEKLKKKTRSLGAVKITVKAAANSENTASANPSETAASIAPAASATSAASVSSAAPKVTPAASNQAVNSSAAPTTPAIASEVPVESTAPTAEPTIDPKDENWNISQANDEEIYGGFTGPKKFNGSMGYDYKALEWELIQYPSTVGTQEMKNCNIMLPRNYSEDKKYPVLYLLHGGGCDENSWKSGKLQYALINLIEQGLADEMIVVSPYIITDLKDKSQSYNNEYDDFIFEFEADLKPYIDSHYSTLPDRKHTAIAGFSMGGRAALLLGLKLTDKIGYICAIESAPGVVGNNALFKEDEFRPVEGYLNNTLLFMVQGMNDKSMGDISLGYSELLTKNGVPHVYYDSYGFKSDGSQGDGAHGWDVWRSAIWNFIRRIFKH